MRSKSKDHPSFAVLVRPHLEKLYRLAYRLTRHREDAQDLVQDVLLKLYRQSERLSEIEAVPTWLSRVLYNQFIDNRRRYSRRRLRIVEHRDFSADPSIAPAEQASTEDLVESQFTITRVLAALDQLSEEHRLIITLHDVEGYTLTEIAEITGLAHGTIKSRRFRARERLQNLLGDGPAGDNLTSEDSSNEENDALREVSGKSRPAS